MELIDGKKVAENYRVELKEKIKTLPSKPGLAVIRVGDDAASEIYVRLKRKMCEELEINFTEYHLNSDIQQDELIGLIKKLNDDKTVNGILLQSPIPYHLNIIEAFETISPLISLFASIKACKLVPPPDTKTAILTILN